MAQNITTLLEKDAAEGLSATDLLYLVQGTGSNRDRKLTLSALARYILSGGEEIDFVKGYQGGHYRMQIDGEKILLTVYSGASETSEQTQIQIDLTNGIVVRNAVSGGGLTSVKITNSGVEVSSSSSSGLSTKLEYDNAVTETLKAKYLKGMIGVDVSTYKLVVTTLLEVLENLIVGSSSNPKKATIYGDLDVREGNANFDCPVNIGSQSKSQYLRVHGHVYADKFTDSGLVENDNASYTLPTSGYGNNDILRVLCKLSTCTITDIEKNKTWSMSQAGVAEFIRLDGAWYPVVSPTLST